MKERLIKKLFEQTCKLGPSRNHAARKGSQVEARQFILAYQGVDFEVSLWVRQVPVEAVTPLQKYYRALEQHDWTYEMSDDSSVYKRGVIAHEELLKQSKTSKAHAKLFAAYVAHVRKGKQRPAWPKE